MAAAWAAAVPSVSLATVKVKLRNPDREVEVAGERKVHAVLGELGIDPDTVLVIRERELLTREDRVTDADVLEIRPVISGGGGGPAGWGRTGGGGPAGWGRTGAGS
jgi:sulfur carrier protein